MKPYCDPAAARATRRDAGAVELNDSELTARVLGGATPSSALRLVAARLCAIPPWERRSIGVEGLVRRHGLSADRAARLAAVWELAERHAPDSRPAIASPRDALLLLEHLRQRRREEVVVLLLDARHRPLGVETVAVGTLNASRLSPRDVFAPALRGDAVAAIVGHNHPSGDPSPSRADRLVTAALRSAGELIGVPLLDHLIVSRRGHHSFRDSEAWDGGEVSARA